MFRRAKLLIINILQTFFLKLSELLSDKKPRDKSVVFISYRHVQPDRKWAIWLHKALESYRVPKRLRQQYHLSACIGRVFRDEDELEARPNLNEAIKDALRRSDYLIVVCSPRTPASEWV